MGQLGDTFQAFGATFCIFGITHQYLVNVADDLYEKEGCETPQDFIKVWESIHPRKGYDPCQKVYVHWFERIDGTYTE